MTRLRFVWLVSLAGIAAAMAIGIVAMSAINERTQRGLQARQVALNSGVLGPQGQQIGNAILQDMAGAATTNQGLRALLLKYGYNVQPATAAPAAAAPDPEAKKAVRDE